MSKKFHMNVKTGIVSRCDAIVQECPLLADAQEMGIENHFDSIGEAREGWEKLVASKREHTGNAPLTKKDVDPKIVELQSTFDQQKATWKKLDNELYNKVKSDPSYKGTEGWYNEVQARRKALYAMMGTEQKMKDSSPELKEKLESEYNARIEKAAANFESWKNRQGTYGYHPEITSAQHAPVSQIITSFSGMTNGDVLRAVSKHMEEGLSEDAAYRKVWAEAPIRTDKRIVALDLETADARYNGRIDNGPYASIIEVGYTVREPDGTVHDGTFLCGVPDGLREAHGTGAVEIHHITTDMVDGLKPFVDDPERQKEVRDLLDGSVLLAHNAKFEVGQFTHSLPGFSDMVDSGRTEILDTQQVCRFFVPETPNNTNKSFVEATGGEYVDAHRALPDAKMSLAALMKLKNVD